MSLKSNFKKICSECHALSGEYCCVCPEIIQCVYLDSFKENQIISHSLILKKLFYGVITWCKQNTRYVLNWTAAHRHSMIQANTYWGKLALQFTNPNFLYQFNREFNLDNIINHHHYDEEFIDTLNNQDCIIDDEMTYEENRRYNKYKQELILVQIKDYNKRVALVKKIINKPLYINNINSDNEDNDIIFIEEIKNSNYCECCYY